MNSLGPIIKFYRAKNNLTQKTFSGLTGVPKITIAKIELGKQMPKEKTIVKILGVIMPEFKSRFQLLATEAELYSLSNKKSSFGAEK